MKNALFIYAPKNCSPSIPLILNNNVVENSIENIFIYAEENSKLIILEDATSFDSNPTTNKNQLYRSSIVEIIAQPNSYITYLSIQSLNENYFNINYNNAILAEDATINWFSVVLGSKFTKQEIATALQGKGARSNNYGLFLGTNSQQFDLYNPIIHNAEHTHSLILAKGAVKQKAKAVYRGMIHIKENAAHATGYQKEDNLILDDGAETDAIPLLFIDNNEVKCSHGATIGQIDNEKLFYMASRGIDEDLAKQMIVEGFFDSLLKELPAEISKLYSEQITEKIKHKIERKLGKQNEKTNN